VGLKRCVQEPKNQNGRKAMKWRVILKGDPTDLKLLAESFANADTLIRQEGDLYTLSSSEFESLDEAGKIAVTVKALIEHINGALLLALGSNVPVSSGGVYELGPDGSRRIYASVHIQGHCRAFATGQVVRADGTIEETRPADPVRQWSDLALRDKAVGDVLTLLGTKPADWVNLYRLYEIVENDSGGIERRGWATRATIRNFKHTANHPEATGLDARHGHLSSDPPARAMLLGEAKALIHSIVQAWLREK
jgi:hypothetical protein